VVLVIAAYPAFVLGPVYAHWFAADLPGGRFGPGDAYRHTLASATVAYTGSPRWVAWVTTVMEGDGQRDPASAMDVHNNRLGARIGASARSWKQMQAAVFLAVGQGSVEIDDPERVTWLPPERWRERWY
jgi:hypothetical protein